MSNANDKPGPGGGGGPFWDPASDRGPDLGPQFGVKTPGADYPERPGAHGVCWDPSGRVALARIRLFGPGGQGRFEYDLPGGGIDEGESPQQALAREFEEETGRKVQVGAFVCRARQFWVSEGRPRNALHAFFLVDDLGEGQKVEPDHDLIWLDPAGAIVKLRHESHVFALTRFLRMRAA